ncbi:NB-ARC domain-containing protein [Arthrobacter sp. H35-D1]|uniref:NB-ARC domain-containing protein n=1 Tax=Arthrobacter sp. H35-D1 TaxID=3046202 RepID=UPI0024B94056|nr:NB-ARC domain-containing protein [Arthrobacter sp. H35-D1]MDJ0314928.1 NB-ARC domain-containing protein [Arthrobacter sp. H35-D1]
MDFADGYKILMANKECLSEDVVDALQRVSPSFERLIAIRNRVAHTRPMEIDDTVFVTDAAGKLISGSNLGWDALRQCLDHLHRNPSYVLGLTVDFKADPTDGPTHNLPIPDFDETGFFGRREQVRRLKKAIKGAYPVVSILGDGGIGKTSIALKVAYELLEEADQPFEAFVWVTAKATILSTNEIKRISGAIESSLGLFAEAARQLGGDPNDPVEELLDYLSNFRILLILDNLETVLDQTLRNFLLDLPMGSKVLVTSRIGLGIENPVQLEPLTIDDSAKLLRALARIRSVAHLSSLSQPEIERLARDMGGHPAYIRWFVSGVQAGKRPEELIGNNALLLDFCMSNVYEYLGEDAKAVLRSMQILSGARNQAALAFLNDFPAVQIQAALLELLTTNFIHMSNSSSSAIFDTVYELSDFGKKYLDKHHRVDDEERTWLLNRGKELTDLGASLAAASSTTPYDAATINIRSAGDIHVGKLLRDAMLSINNPEVSLSLCREAQELAPQYYEAWRVEGHVRASSQDLNALIAFERALDLAPDSPVLHYHFGAYLLAAGGDPTRALQVLQQAARLDPGSPEIAAQIAWAHHSLNDPLSTIGACRHIVALPKATKHDVEAATLIALRSACQALLNRMDIEDYDAAVELLETATEIVVTSAPGTVSPESRDVVILLVHRGLMLAEHADEYPAQMAKVYRSRLSDALASTSSGLDARQVGKLKHLKSEQGFGFVSSGPHEDYFVHARDLIDMRDWESLQEGAICIFQPSATVKGPRATKVRIFDQ